MPPPVDHVVAPFPSLVNMVSAGGVLVRIEDVLFAAFRYISASRGL